MTWINGSNPFPKEMSEADKKLYNKEAKCNSCGRKCTPAYIKPVLCMDCAVEIYGEEAQ